MTTRSMLGWFAPPELPRPDLHRRARALWIVSWPFFAVVAVVLAIAGAVEPDTLSRRAVTVAAVGALITVLHMISRAGRPVLASWVLVLGLSIIVTQRAWITGGIHAPVAVFYVLFIVMASVLIGSRGGYATAAVCLLGAIFLTIGTSMGWLTPRPGAGSALAGFVFVVLAIGLALVIQAMVAFGPRRDGLNLNAQMLVHDMRSPLWAVLANLQLLRSDVREESIKDVDGAIEGAMELNRMTSTLLDVSRLEAGRMPVRPSVTELSGLAQSVVASLRVIQPARDIRAELNGSTECKCDPDLTRRIIENLVINAMKHTPVTCRVSVSVSGSQHAVQVSVTDEGAGIAHERRTKIFEPYMTDDRKRATDHDSSGLGLAFCKLAAEAQGAVIRIEDAVPRGSVFTVEFRR